MNSEYLKINYIGSSCSNKIVSYDNFVKMMIGLLLLLEKLVSFLIMLGNL